VFGSGAVGATVAVGTTFTSSFIPWLQCPGIPQMKYLFPGVVRGTKEFPLANVISGLTA